MRAYNSQKAVVDRNANVTTSYCDNKTLLEPDCNEKRQEALRNNCVTPEYIELLKTVPVQGGLGVAPICGVGSEGGKLYWFVINFCKCGCFSKDTTILSRQEAEEAEYGIDELFQLDRRYLQALTHDSLIGEELIVATRPFTPLQGPAERRQWIHLNFSNGRSLKLTTDHSVLLFDGELKSAGLVNVGDRFFDRQNGIVEVTAKHVSEESLKTFNVSIEAEIVHPLNHIFFANGVAIGDDSFQNGFQSLVNRANLR
jgi:hypothetical protein